MDLHDMADREAERIENDESLTDKEKTRYLKELGEELCEAENQR